MSEPMLDPRGFYRPTYVDRHGVVRRSAIFWTRDPRTGRRVSTGCRDRLAAYAWREAQRKTADLPSVALVEGPGVYLVEAGGFLKIGCSKVSIARRLRTIQADQPHPVKLLGVASRNPLDERRIKRRFARFRVRGEWFRITDASLALVAEVLR